MNELDKIPPGVDILRIGSASGLGMGILLQTQTSYHFHDAQWENMVEVEWVPNQPTHSGDSGSIWYARLGFLFVPIAIRLWSPPFP